MAAWPCPVLAAPALSCGSARGYVCMRWEASFGLGWIVPRSGVREGVCGSGRRVGR